MVTLCGQQNVKILVCTTVNLQSPVLKIIIRAEKVAITLAVQLIMIVITLHFDT